MDFDFFQFIPRMLCFAAGDGGLGGGAGTGGGGAQPSIGWSGDFGGDVSDSGDGTTGGADTGIADAGSGDVDTSAASDVDTQDDDTAELDFDADVDTEKPVRGVPNELKEALKDKPEVLKTLKNRLLRGDRYEALGASPEELRGTLDRIESMGGLSGIEAESNEWAKVMNGFRAGDPAVLETWFKDNPQGISKLMPEAWKRYAEMDAPGWNHENAKTFVATVESNGMWTALNQLEGRLKDDPESAKLAKAIKDEVLKINQIALNQPKRDLTPEQKKLDEKSVQLDAKERAFYAKTLSAESTPLMGKAASDAIGIVTKGYKLTPDARKGFQEDVLAAFNKLCHADELYQKNALAAIRGQESEAFKRLLKSQLTDLMPKAARMAWRKYAGISGLNSAEAQRRKAEGQGMRESASGGASNGSLIQSTPPNGAEIDRARMLSVLKSSDKVDDALSFGIPGMHGGKRWYFKKGIKDKTFTY